MSFASILVYLHDDYVITSVQYNGGFLPDVILLTLCYYHWGTRSNAMKFFFVFAACFVVSTLIFSLDFGRLVSDICFNKSVLLSIHPNQGGK